MKVSEHDLVTCLDIGHLHLSGLWLDVDLEMDTQKTHVSKRLDDISLYSLIGDFFLIWRLIKDFKSDVMFSAGFDYDIDTYYIYIYIPHA